MSVLCSSQNFIHKFNAVWFGGLCLASCQTVAKWFTEVQMLFLPAMWTTSVCEYQFILVPSECVNSVGSCRAEAGCRDQVQWEGWSVHLTHISPNQCQPPATWALIANLFPCLGRRVMPVMLPCCKSKDGKPGKSHWLSVAFLCFTSGGFFPPLGFGLFKLCD